MNTFSDPLKIINQLELVGAEHIADFGSGSGAYSLALAKKNPLGKVFAIDIRKEMVEHLDSIAKREGIDNLRVIWGDIDEEKGSRLRDKSIDFVLLTNVLFQLENKKACLVEAKRILKKEGKILIVDWTESFGNIGPHEDHIVSESTAKLLAEENGFLFEKNIQAGEHHYGFIARKL